jgi:hypothetical protein
LVVFIIVLLPANAQARRKSRQVFYPFSARGV